MFRDFEHFILYLSQSITSLQGIRIEVSGIAYLNKNKIKEKVSVSDYG